MYIWWGRQNPFRITDLFCIREVYSICVADKSSQNTKEERKREREEASTLKFVIAKYLGVMEPPGSVESFNFHSSGERKPGRFGYRFSRVHKLRKTARTLRGVNVS